MPEAPMHEDREAVFWKYDVWLAGQIRPVKSEPITETVCDLPDRKFWRGIFGTHLCHKHAALGRRKMIGHSPAATIPSFLFYLIPTLT